MALLAATAWLLWTVGGPPRSPAGLLDFDRVASTLQSTWLAGADVSAVATTVAWLALGYLALSGALRLLIMLLAQVSGGAAWVQDALTASDVITLPVVRRVVDGALAGTLLAASWLPVNPARATAATPERVPVVALRLPEAATASAPTDHYRPEQTGQQNYVEYTVARGDYLWDIARRLYGDGSRWVEIFEANRGRMMVDGGRFTDPNRLETGWRLRIPLPARHLEAGDGKPLRYQVRPGDSLWRIAERLLADGFRWTELWELNGGREMPGGRRFTDPDLIHPGWWLDLPASPRTAADRAPTVDAIPTLEPSPTVVAGPPDPVAGSEPDADTGQMPGPGSGPDWSWPSVPGVVTFTAAGFAALGGAVILVRRLHGAGQLAWPAARHRRRGGLGDAGRVTLAARALRVALADIGFDDVRALYVIEDGDRLTFGLRCAPGDADAVVAARHELGRRLACRVGAELFGSTRVTLQLDRFQRLAALLLEDAPDPQPLLVPVGAGDEGIVYLDLGAVGSTAVVGDPSERRTMLSAWLATLRTAHGPESAMVRCDAQTAALLGDPGTGDAAAAEAGDDLFSELEELVLAREEDGSGRPLVALLDAQSGIDGRVDALSRRGPRVGAYVVVGRDGTSAHLSAASGAVVGFTRATASPDEEAGESPDILLQLPGGERIALEPVRVRVDDSTYWRGPSGEATPPPGQMALDGGELDVDQSPQMDIPEEGDATAIEPLPDDDADDDGASPAAPIPPDEAREERESVLATTSTTALLESPPPATGHTGARGATAPTSGAAVAVRQAALLVEDPATTDAAAVGVVAVRCLGLFEVECAGIPIEHWRVQKSRELLAFLISRGGSVAREVVMEALWPEEEPKRCAQMLHTAAHYLRRTLREASGQADAAFVVSASGRYRLEPGLFQVDLDRFEEHLRRAQSAGDADGLDEITEAVRLYRGGFLEEEPYEWAEAFRADFGARFAAAAHVGGEAALSAGDLERARGLFERVLALDATDEEAARGLMRIHAAAGDVSGVRKVYRALTEALRRELDDEVAVPGAETEKLMTIITSTSH